MLFQLTRRLRSSHDDRYHDGAIDHGVMIRGRVAQTTLAKRQRPWLTDKRAGALKV